MNDILRVGDALDQVRQGAYRVCVALSERAIRAVGRICEQRRNEDEPDIDPSPLGSLWHDDTMTVAAVVCEAVEWMAQRDADLFACDLQADDMRLLAAATRAGLDMGALADGLPEALGSLDALQAATRARDQGGPESAVDDPRRRACDALGRMLMGWREP